MVSKTQNLFEIIVVLAIGFIITVVINGFIATITYPVSAQTNSVGNMTFTMMKSARFHLKTADELLLEGDTAQH
jgi:hypothetical protein